MHAFSLANTNNKVQFSFLIYQVSRHQFHNYTYFTEFCVIIEFKCMF